MRDFRLFSSRPLAVGDVLPLDEAAHRHVGKVLRLRVGAPLVLFNGDGFDYAAELVSCDRRASQVRIVAREAAGNESPLNLTLFAALLKGEAMDRVVQKAVELAQSGLCRCVPRAARRCLPMSAWNASARIGRGLWWRVRCSAAAPLCRRWTVFVILPMCWTTPPVCAGFSRRMMRLSPVRRRQRR